MERVWVVGTTGSGKTTLARRLAQHLGCEHVELDALHWQPDWTGAPEEEFLRSVSAALVGGRWVVDGNYRRAREVALQRADTLVWLDYSIGTVLTRLIWRTARRGLLRERLWNGNRERVLGHLLTRESIILWALQTHWKRRRHYSRMAADRDYRHLRVHRLRSPLQTERWFRSLADEAARQRPGPRIDTGPDHDIAGGVTS